jgi:hypothetical protein
MRDILLALISYGAAFDSALLGLWLAARWPAPGWKQFTAAGSLFMGMNVVMQILVS